MGRNPDSYTKTYGPEGLKLFTLLQREANLKTQIEKLKKKLAPLKMALARKRAAAARSSAAG